MLSCERIDLLSSAIMHRVGISDFGMTSSLSIKKAKVCFFSKTVPFHAVLVPSVLKKNHDRKKISQSDCIIQNSATFFETVRWFLFETFSCNKRETRLIARYSILFKI